MLSYLPYGLSAVRSYIERKAHIISFFSHLFGVEGNLFDRGGTFFLRQINKAYTFYKIS